MVAAVRASDGIGGLLGADVKTAFTALETRGTHFAEAVPLVVATVWAALRAGLVAVLHIDAALHAVIVHHAHTAQFLPLVDTVLAAAVGRRSLLGLHQDGALFALVVFQARSHSGRQDEYCHNSSGYQSDSLFHNIELFLQRYNFFSIHRSFFIPPSP